MRSYGVARGLFTLIAAIAWLMIGLGVLLLLFAFNGGSSALIGYGSEMAMLLTGLPGVVLVLIGLLTLAVAQIGRSGVDTAEYTQQMLQISRETLEVSRQSLRQGDQRQGGFEALRSDDSDRPMADYAQGLEGQPTDKASSAPTPPAVTYGTLSGVTSLPEGGNPARIEVDQVSANVAATYAKSPSGKAI